LDKVCDELSIDFFDADFNDSKISGMLIKDKETNKFGIYVNRKHSAVRQRFTIAHEIGHFLSYKHQSHSFNELNNAGGIEDYAMSFRKENSFSIAETEANLIAAEMLMPEDKIEKMKENNLTIEEMADEFFVSEAAMTIRLKALYPDLIVV
jgi:Zn-dependent peptidase ImmA (M78 family)